MRNIFTVLVVAVAMIAVFAGSALAGSYSSGTSWKLTNDGGMAIKVTSDEGATTIIKGMPLALNATSKKVKIAAANEYGEVVGVAAETATAGSTLWMTVAGAAKVLIGQAAATVSKGLFLETALGTGYSNATEAFNSTSLAKALETVATSTSSADANRTVDALFRLPLQ